MSYNSKGYEFERIVAEELERQGYEVKQTKKSGDFGVDIIARKGEGKIAIQVKNTRDPVGVKAVQEVFTGKRYYRCKEAWVVSTSGFTKRAKELARKTRVKLLTWEDLKEMGNTTSRGVYSYFGGNWGTSDYFMEYTPKIGVDQKSHVNGVTSEWYFKESHRGIPENKHQKNVNFWIKTILLILWVGFWIVGAVILLVPINHQASPTSTMSPSPVIPTQSTPKQTKIQEPLTIVLPAMDIPQIQNTTVIFSDDFEEYRIGNMGQQNGWFLIWGWSGKSFEQKVVAGVSVSGSKSFQLWGDPCRSAGYHRYLYFNKSYLQLRKMNNKSIGLETYIGIEGYGNPKCGDKFENNATAGIIGFWNSDDKKYYALVTFKRDGGIYANGVLIGKWEPKKWYHIRIILNWQKGAFDVYLNGKKVGNLIPINKFNVRYPNYDGIIIGSGHAGVRVFFDDFAIFMVNGTGMSN